MAIRVCTGFAHSKSRSYARNRQVEQLRKCLIFVQMRRTSGVVYLGALDSRGMVGFFNCGTSHLPHLREHQCHKYKLIFVQLTSNFQISRGLTAVELHGALVVMNAVDDRVECLSDNGRHSGEVLGKKKQHADSLRYTPHPTASEYIWG